MPTVTVSAFPSGPGAMLTDTLGATITRTGPLSTPCHRARPPPRPRPRRVDRPVPSHGEQPAPEVLFIAVESLQVTNHLQPGLARDVIGIVAAQDTKIAQQTRLQVPPKLKEPGLVTRPGTRQHPAPITRLCGHCASQGRTPAETGSEHVSFLSMQPFRPAGVRPISR
jgi:hypothetical protein